MQTDLTRQQIEHLKSTQAVLLLFGGPFGAQHGVFSLPVVQLYIEGRLCLERGQNFSLLELGTEIERIYGLWKPAPDGL